MDKILQLVQQRKELVVLVGGGVLGLLLGLAIGWGLWPVQWTNATPADLRLDFQKEYVLWVGEQYADSGDLEQARDRLGAEYWKEGQLADRLEGLVQEQSGEKAVQLRAMARALEAEPEATEAAAEPVTSRAAGLRPVAMVCGVGLLVVAVVGGALYLFRRFREARAQPQMAERPGGVAIEEGPLFTERISWEDEGPPVAQFVTTYVLGDDHYDPSFSIELENGEFVGECGVGISETVGVGEPSKVAALEAWLFDKNDIRTVTKVLMSDYAFHDEALRAKLAPKGEPMLAEAGKEVTLETRGLRVEVSIVEAEYGEGDLPPNSFFNRLTVDLAAWVRPE